MLSSPLIEVMDKAETTISFPMVEDLWTIAPHIEALSNIVRITTKELALSRNVLTKHSANLKLLFIILLMEVVEMGMSLKTMVEHAMRIVTPKLLTSVIIPI
jgi:hypothetical protein